MRQLSFHLVACIGLLILSYAPLSNAALITVSPSSQDVLLGDTASVDVILEQPNGNFVGAFDFFINFNPSILALANVVQGTALGGPFDSLFDSISDVGRVNVSEVSLVFDLSVLQDTVSDLVLFTLEFDTLAIGNSALTPEENILGSAGGFVGDDLGFGIALDAIINGSITVFEPAVQPPSDVSEPGTAFSAILMLSGLLYMRKQRKSPSIA